MAPIEFACRPSSETRPWRSTAATAAHAQARVIGVSGAMGTENRLKSFWPMCNQWVEQASAREQKGSSDVFSHVSLNHFSTV